MTPESQTIARTMTLTAGIVAVLLVVGLPGAHFAFAYEYMLGALDTQADVAARDTGRLVFANPTTWSHEQVRLAELLERRSSSGVPEARRILDAAGRVVAESADPLSPPILARRHAIRDAGGLVAEVEVARSLRPLLLETALALGLAALAAALVFGALRAIPLEAVEQAHRSLAESERRYRSLYETMREGMALHRIVRDAEGRAVSLTVVDANPACALMLGLEEASCAGREATTLLGGAFVPFIPRMLEAAKDGQPRTFELSPPDHGRTIRVSVFSPSDGHLATLLEDVTERRHLQEQLAHAQKIQAVGLLAGGVAHDFNNILTVILSYAGALRSALQGEQRELAQEIEKGGQRAAALTRQLLAFSRKQVLRPEVLRVNEVVANITRMIGRLIGEHITLSLEMAEDIGCLRMDAAQLEQVLVNLAVNARDAMPGGGKLTIGARNAEVTRGGEGRPGAPKPDRYVVLTVSDTGTGMDEATRSRIFEPFFTTKARGKGTGLGLVVVFDAVRQCGGFIDIATVPGAGTTVTIHLPRVDDLPASRQEAPQPEEPAGRGARILLVDDEPQLRAAVRLILASGGYSVVEAPGGDEGLAAFRADSGGISLVLTDLVMPGMSGLALGRAIRGCRPVPVLYMSGYSEEVASGQETLPPESFLQKPLERTTLLERVASAMEHPSAASVR